MEKKDNIKYDKEIDINDKNTVYYKILEEIKPNTTILEVGCSTGYFTKILKEIKKCKVDCIEIDKEAAKLAKKFCDKIIISDIETLDFSNYFEEKYYDTILLADVLEHLKYPEILLEKLKNYLKEEGFLLISIPNITHASIALNIINGKWEYKPIGLLDETHLRFFDKQSFLNLLEEKGFCPIKIKRVIINPWDTEFKTPYSKYPKEIINYIEKNNPDYNTYQFIIKAIPFNKFTSILILKERIKDLQKEIDTIKNEKDKLIDNLNKEKSQLKDKIFQLEQENIRCKNKINILEEENKLLNNNLQEKNQIIENLKNELTEKNFILSEIYNSILWKIGSSYRNVIEKILPQGSRPRKYYSLFNESLKIISKNGITEFLKKGKKYLKKTFSEEDLDFKLPLLEKNWHYLEFPEFKNPVFSIIIPVYNNAIYTFNCLKSILKHTKIPYEIIIVNDCSTDETSKMLSLIKNIKIIHNKENKGFIESCNIGAKESHGEFILFLNNDTMVTENWLENIQKTFEKFSDVGIVGVKLIFPDGKLQEAGSIIFSDGSAWNYGKFDDPTNPEYNYIKKVDYCSGACIAIRKKLFFEVGGFDENLKPAYYEDTDLAMQIREKNLHVYYQPFSIVFHFEGITSGKDTSSGTKKYQEINKTKFINKWKNVLLSNHYPPGTSLFIAREKIDKGIILVIDHYVPSYDKDSGSLRMYSILKLLTLQGWKVIFWPDNLAKIEPYTSELQWIGVEVIYGHKNFFEYIKENGKYIDYILLSRPHISKNYIDKVKLYSDAIVIYDTVDLHYLREERRAKVENNPRILEEANTWKNIEFYICKKSDIILTITENEKNILKNEFKNKEIKVLPNIHIPTTNIKPFNQRKNIMFIGSYLHPPNIDAVKWFTNEIFHEILKNIKEIKFYIIGNEPPDEIKKLTSENIIVTGFVKNVAPYFQNCRVFVSPLRYGAGLKGKIGQSMSFGLPVVTTSIGAEGFIFEKPPFLIADDAKTFAEKVIELYLNETLWKELSMRGIEIIEKYYSPQKINEILKNIFKK